MKNFKFISFMPLLSLVSFISYSSLFSMKDSREKEEISGEELAKRPEVINKMLEGGHYELLLTFVDAIDNPHVKAATIISLLGENRVKGGNVESALIRSLDSTLDTLDAGERTTLLTPLRKDPAYYRLLNQALINKLYPLVSDLLSYTKFLPAEGFDPLEEIKKQWLEANDEDKNTLEWIAISAKLNPDFADENGMTPLMRAAQQGDSFRINGLLQLGASLSKQNKEGKTALDIAIENNNQEAKKALESK